MSSSSSLSPSATSSDAAASASPSDSGSGGGGGPPSSTLYLLTFLATLFVLLFVSCAIVLRSFVLRRRFRQQVEEQIAAGLLPPEALWNYGKRDFGEQPKLYDVGVFPSAQVESWSSMSPMSASVLPDKATTPNGTSSEASDPPQSSVRPSRFTRLIQRHRTPPEPPSEDAAPDTPIPLDGGKLQITVLLAMPSPRKITDGVPEVAIGVSQIPLRAEDGGH